MSSVFSKIKKSLHKRRSPARETSPNFPPAVALQATLPSPPNVVSSSSAANPPPVLTPGPAPTPALALNLSPTPALVLTPATTTPVIAPTPALAPKTSPPPSASPNLVGNALVSIPPSLQGTNTGTAQCSGIRASNLWGRALEKLRKKGLSGLDSRKDCDIQLFRDLLAETEARRKECDAKRFFYENSRGEKAFYADAIIKQLNKYALIGDIAIQHHPDVVALAWGGFRLLLQVGTAYIENMAIISDSLEYLVSVIFCCDIYEKLYSGIPAAEPLHNSMVDLYAEILEYLLCAKKLLQKSTMIRVLESFSSGPQTLLGSIQKLERVAREKADIAEKGAASNERAGQAKRANVLRSLLVEVQVSIQSIERTVIDSCRKIGDIWENVESEKRIKVLGWVSDVEYGSHHAEFKSRRHRNTGNWLLENGRFGDWKLSSLKRIFWLRGDAGSGKTMLASKVIDTFKDRLEPNHALAYFYCYFQEPARSDPRSILRAIVKQLCVAYSEKHLPKPLMSIYEKRQKEAYSTGQLTIIESKDLIIKLLEEFGQTTIIIDALDECDPKTRQGLLRILKEIVTSRASVKIFLTSRNEGDIRDMLDKIPNHYIDAKDNSDDIKKYIRTEIEQFCSDRPLLKVDSALKCEIISTLERQANGMFMWVHLQIQTIRNEVTTGDVRRALENLPEDLDKTYLNILERIRNQSKAAHRRAHMVLKWVLCTQGICSPERLGQALLVEPMATTLDKDQLMDRHQILSVCRNLVVYDNELEVLRFAHFSVKEFLRGQREFSLAEAHNSIAEICLTVLINYPDRDTCPVPELLEYAVRNWAVHVRLSEGGSSNLKSLWQSFLKPSSASYQAWAMNIGLWWDGHELKSVEAEIISPLWVACYYQLYDIFVFLLKNGFVPGCHNQYGTTPLIHAAARGYEDFVGLLMRKDGVNVNCTDKGGRTPLLGAADGGYKKVVEMLLGKDGVDMNCKDKDGWTPLLRAASRGYEKVVEILLGKDGVDVNCKDRDGWTPLLWAASRGYEEVVEILLGKDGVDVNFKDKDGWTPLLWAANMGYGEVVDLLLGKDGVDVNCKDRDGCTPLLWATNMGHEKVVEMLLGKDGVDVNCKDKYD